MRPSLSKQLAWARGQASQQRRMISRYAGQPNARAHAERQLALAEAAAATLAALAAKPDPTTEEKRP